MTKVKTFEFRVSNWLGRESAVWLDAAILKKQADYNKKHKSLTDPNHIFSPAEMDKVVNDFITDKDVIDIKVSNYIYDRHNNGYCDSVVEVYTVLYKE